MEKLKRLIAVRKNFGLLGFIAFILCLAYGTTLVLVLHFGKSFGLWPIIFLSLALFLFCYILWVDNQICKSLKLVFCDRLKELLFDDQTFQNIDVVVKCTNDIFTISVICKDVSQHRIVIISQQIVAVISIKTNHAIPIKVEVLYQI